MDLTDALRRLVAEAEDGLDCGSDHYDEPVVTTKALSALLDEHPRSALTVGSQIHGFANGVFGRDSYSCRIVEAEGADWLVTRNLHGEVEKISKVSAEMIDDPDDRDYCGHGEHSWPT